MSPRNRNQQNFDFEIHVDESELSAPTGVRSDMETLVNAEGETPLTETKKLDDWESDLGKIEEQHDQEAVENHADHHEDQHDGSVNDLEEGSQRDEHDEEEEHDEQQEDSLCDSNIEPSEHDTSIVDSNIDPSEHETSIVDSTVEPSEHDTSVVDSEAGHEIDTSIVDSEADHEVNYTETASSTSQSRRTSHMSDTSRRASGRTEALIHAAARNIVAQIEHGHQRDSLQSTSVTEEETENDYTEGEEHDGSFVSQSQLTSGRPSDAHSLVQSIEQDDEEGEEEDMHEEQEEVDAAGDDTGDNSSHHENEDDVFSDHSPRSSVGSISDPEQLRKLDDAVTQRTRSPRISNFSQYDQDEDFIPTVRGTPRPAFRSPSSVKAIQMSSPPPSVLGSPRSSRRRSPLPTVSRLASPNFSSTQYSPKKTPPRFRRSTPPLVLLHATLLPLRWPWGDVLDSVTSAELTPEAKTLREAWHQLHDRMGDTVFERGILLPHPQNDFEILEERLLEALDLPLRRRARILECGHYLGPTNEASFQMDSESEEDDMDGEDYDYHDGAKSPRQSYAQQQSTHWCTTCRSDIKNESLGQGKIFRVKVYASNGLMKAGAWEACWKEMERVDVEIEPVVEAAVADELSRLAAEQEHESAMQYREVTEEVGEREDEQMESSMLQPEHVDRSQLMPSSPPPPAVVAQEMHSGMSPSPSYDERRRRDEERLREIYGHTPPPATTTTTAAATRNSTHQQTSAPPSASAYIPLETPPSPSVEAMERRQERRQSYKSASLPELLLEAVKVLVRDKKNVVIGLLSLLIMTLAVQGGGERRDERSVGADVFGAGVVKGQSLADVPTVTVTQAALSETVPPPLETVSEAVVSSSVADVVDPCSSADGSVAPSVVRVVETITETAVETETVRVTATEKVTAPTETMEVPSGESATVAESEPINETVEEAGDVESGDKLVDDKDEL